MRSGEPNPAGEVLAALRPGLSTTNGLLLGISSPYSKSGALYEAFREHYGKPNSPVPVWKATSREMNPTLNPLVVQAALMRDRAAASSEYLGEFRDDIGGFLSIEEIERVVVRGRTLLPYVEGLKYKAFCDPSGGRNDSMVLALPSVQGVLGVIEYWKGIASGKYPNPMQLPNPASAKSTEPNKDGTPSAPQDGTCPGCRSTCVVKLHAWWHCNSCGIDFGLLPEVARLKRSDVLAGHYPVTRK